MALQLRSIFGSVALHYIYYLGLFIIVALWLWVLLEVEAERAPGKGLFEDRGVSNAVIKNTIAVAATTEAIIILSDLKLYSSLLSWEWQARGSFNTCY